LLLKHLLVLLDLFLLLNLDLHLLLLRLIHLLLLHLLLSDNLLLLLLGEQHAVLTHLLELLVVLGYILNHNINWIALLIFTNVYQTFLESKELLGLDGETRYGMGSV
jgi:hypothetical protein